jgi:RNA ligase
MSKEPVVTDGQIAELLDPQVLEAHIRNRVINRRSHPRLPLAILNYGQKAQFEQLWDSVVCRCRGLIYHYETGDIVAVPFAKFFNYDTGWREETFPENLPTDEPEITRKLDGSLGILWRFQGHHGIATRGSFESEQAKWATAWFDKNTHPSKFPAGWTPLFEVIYPENRVVVRYDYEGLTIIGCVNNETGEEMTHDGLVEMGLSAGVPVVDKINETIEDLTLRDDENEEGFVACWHKDEGPPLRVKIKFATYFRLHRLLTGTSPKRVWESLRDGQDLKAIMDDTPSHFNAWVQGWESKLTANFKEIEAEAVKRFSAVGQFHPDRKTFAMWANQPENKQYAPALFKLLDKSPYADVIWKHVRPAIEGLGTFKSVDE